MDRTLEAFCLWITDEVIKPRPFLRTENVLNHKRIELKKKEFTTDHATMRLQRKRKLKYFRGHTLSEVCALLLLEAARSSSPKISARTELNTIYATTRVSMLDSDHKKRVVSSWQKKNFATCQTNSCGFHTSQTTKVALKEKVYVPSIQLLKYARETFDNDVTKNTHFVNCPYNHCES